MSGQAIAYKQPMAGWRMKLGVTILVLSILAPLVGLLVVAALSLSATMTTTISGALLVGGEVFGILAVAIMGKPGFTYIKNCVFGFLKMCGPPKEVSRGRYSIGLIMFCVPILFGGMSPYFIGQIPGFEEVPLTYVVGGDLMLLASLFVLGGDFWDKLRTLFIYDARAIIPRKPATRGTP